MPEGTSSQVTVTIGGQEVSLESHAPAAMAETTNPPRISVDLEMASTPEAKQSRERAGFALLAIVLLAVIAALIVILRLSAHPVSRS